MPITVADLQAVREIGRFIADRRPEDLGSYLQALTATGDLLAAQHIQTTHNER